MRKLLFSFLVFRQLSTRTYTSNNRMASSPLILQVIALAKNTACKAGSIVREVMSKGELGIVQKGHNDLQTEADRTAQSCIIASLARKFPKMAIIGEETLDPDEAVKKEWIIENFDEEVLTQKCPDEFANVKEEDIVVWVDPLDGTSEYTQGLLEHVTVLIGISVNGKAVGGVIHQPYFNYKRQGSSLGRTMWGLLGLGVFGISPIKPPEGQRIVTTTRSHSNRLVQAALDSMEPTEILRVGGAGHKVLLLIEGKAHGYVFASAGCKKWDTCAPEVLLQCAGGKLTDVHGNTLAYHKEVQHQNSGGVLATFDKSNHDWYLNRIPQEVRAALTP